MAESEFGFDEALIVVCRIPVDPGIDSIGEIQSDFNPAALDFAGGSAAKSETFVAYNPVSGVECAVGTAAADGGKPV